MTRKFLWGLLAVIMTSGAAGCETRKTPTPAIVSGQPAGAEKTGGKENAGGEAVTETSTSQSTKDDGKTYTIRIVIISSDSHLRNIVLNEWTQEVREKASGRLILKVMGSSQLGGERDCVEGMQLGDIEMTRVSSAVANGPLNDFSLLSFPYFFKDYMEMEKMFNRPIGNGLFAEFEGIDIKGLTWFPNGFRNVYTKNTPVATPVDMKGLEICVMENDVIIATLSTMGASETPMAYNELYSAIQQSVMDEAENAPGNIYSDGYYGICKNVSLTKHFTPPGVVTISQKSYDSLPDDLRKCPAEPAIRFGKTEREMDEKLQEGMEKRLEGKGVQINEVNKQSFINTTTSIYTEYAGGINNTVKVLAEEELGKSFD